MISWLAEVAVWSIAVGASCFVLGYRRRARYDGAAWELAARYKVENDALIERLTEIEELLMED